MSTGPWAHDTARVEPGCDADHPTAHWHCSADLAWAWHQGGTVVAACGEVVDVPELPSPDAPACEACLDRLRLDEQPLTRHHESTHDAPA